MLCEDSTNTQAPPIILVLGRPRTAGDRTPALLSDPD